MKLVAISTCPSRSVDYLPETLRLLGDAGANRVPTIIFSDGPRKPEDLPWPRGDWFAKIESPNHRGSRRNLQQVLLTAHAWCVRRLVFFEDDVHPCRNAVRRMLSLPIPDEMAFVTAHDHSRVACGAAYGLHAAGFEREFQHSQALIFPGSTVRYLAEAIARQRTKHPVAERMKADVWLGETLAGGPWTGFGVHVPSLVRHVGFVSIAHENPSATGDHNYPGDDFDAEALPPP